MSLAMVSACLLTTFCGAMAPWIGALYAMIERHGEFNFSLAFSALWFAVIYTGLRYKLFQRRSAPVLVTIGVSFVVGLWIVLGVGSYLLD